MAQTAVLFPGQGSLTPDSGAYADGVWPDLVEQASWLVKDDVFARAAESTRFAQPAIFVASMAGWRERESEIGAVCAMAGHSLGELSALVAAGALSVSDGLSLVVLRGQLMHEAAAGIADGGMVAVLGGSPSDAAALAARHGLTVANDNAPGQVVLSGPVSAIQGLTAVARSEGFKTMVLDVAGAFHSASIAAAEAPFREALEEVEWSEPRVPVISGHTVAPFTDMPAELSRALVNPVRWREVMGVLHASGAREFVDVGPGKVLSRLVTRNLPALEEDVLVR
jgi:malonyl CoA-acyl carrier protein transacylase